MRSIQQLMDHPLTLVQPKMMKQHHELRFGGEIVATVSFPKIFSSRAVIATADGIWSVTQEGFIRKKILAVREGESTDGAVCSVNSWSGETSIVLPKGMKYVLKTNIWKSLTELKKEDGKVVVTIHTKGFWRNTTTLTMNRTAGVSQDLPLLVILSIYIVIMMRRDSHAAVIASVHS